MTLPKQFLESLEGISGFERDAFLQAHEAGNAATSVRINPAKYTAGEIAAGLLSPNHAFNVESQVPWSQYGYYLSGRPSFTFDPLFHAGRYYVQEASSMFLEQALMQHVEPAHPLRMLDLSAAPGGKSTHMLSLASKGLLVSNEVIRNRAAILAENITRWGLPNIVVTSNDPSAFGRLEHFFDVLVVDAPCSGSGLFRKDPGAISEWSPAHVTLCSRRQQRILADALPALRKGGLLVYATCSYSVEEDEANADWLVQEFGVEPLAIRLDPTWGSITETRAPVSGAPGYRFFPHRLKGEGFYLACFRKVNGSTPTPPKSRRREKASMKDAAVVQPWIQAEDLAIMQHGSNYFAFPSHFSDEFHLLQDTLYLVYAGVRLGQVMHDKFIPDHALAVSTIRNQGIPRTPLSADDAIRYLQRRDMTIHPDRPGWQLVTFHDHPLGWINALKNRVNNYYPKEMRILKAQND